MEILIINFTLDGMTESAYQDLADQVAPAFAAVPGLVSKVWLADRDANVYGGVYTFDDAASTDTFMTSDLFAQIGATPGFAGITVRRFGVLTAATEVTRGLVSTPA
jgi:hypothetical protein